MVTEQSCQQMFARAVHHEKEGECVVLWEGVDILRMLPTKYQATAVRPEIMLADVLLELFLSLVMTVMSNVAHNCSWKRFQRSPGTCSLGIRLWRFAHAIVDMAQNGNREDIGMCHLLSKQRLASEVAERDSTQAEPECEQCAFRYFILLAQLSCGIPLRACKNSSIRCRSRKSCNRKYSSL